MQEQDLGILGNVEGTHGVVRCHLTSSERGAGY
jgi:hypothetical protein